MKKFDELLINCTLINKTENFTKSYTVNRLSTVVSEELANHIEEIGDYDFDLLLAWLQTKEGEWYRGKWKAAKRFLYMMDDLYHDREFPSDGKYVYFNAQSKYLLLSDSDNKLINEFLESYTAFSKSYHNEIRQYVSIFLRYLEIHSISLSDLKYDPICDFIYTEKKNHSSVKIFDELLSTNSNFLLFCYETGYLKNQLFSFIMNEKESAYYKYLCSIRNSIGIENLSRLNNSDSMRMLSFERIEEFKDVYYELHYNAHHTAHIDYTIYQYALFLDVTGLEFNLPTISYWSNMIMSHISGNFKEKRLIITRYFDYIHGELNMNFIHLYKFSRYDTQCPFWAKAWCDKYIAYRLRVGMKKSTISMDKNSILRFVMFLNKKGISDYEQITAEDIIEFHYQDEHSTVEGKNAYIARIRGFLSYLKDEGVINNVYDSVITQSIRKTQKVVTVLDADILQAVYDHKDDFTTLTQLRSYCLFLLGVRMGLRASDAAALKKDNISFKNMSISFVQMKTQNSITIPMPMMVANSIYRYLKVLSKNTDSVYLFQTVTAPYRTPTVSIAQNAVRVVLNLLGIDSTGISFHTLRRTYASNIVRNSHTIGEAAYALGHNDNGTVDKYLSLDTENMKFCTLDLHLIPFGGFSI